MKVRNKVAALLMAGTMMVALPSMALAYDGVSAGSNFAGQTTIEKTWNAPSSLQMNADEVFNFTVTFNQSKSEAIGSFAAPELSNITAGLSDGSKTVSINGGWTVSPSGSDVTKTQTINAQTLLSGLTFNAPGKYYFDIAEVTGQNPNVTYSQTVGHAVVYVTVVANDPTKIEVSAVQMYSGSEKAKKITFVNDSNAVGGAKDFKITKEIAGQAANADDVFTFTVTLKGGLGSYAITTNQAVTEVSGAAVSGDSGSKVVTFSDKQTPVTLTVKMKGTGDFAIKNLPNGATATVEESAASLYTPSFTFAAQEGTSGLGKALSTGEVTLNSGNENNTAAFVNTTDAVNPGTGLMMQYGPFILIGVVAIAGMALLIASRRRSSDEF